MQTETKENSIKKSEAASPNGDLAPDEAALAAYCLWEEEGHAQGHEVDHWLRAEELLQKARQHSQARPTPDSRP